MKAFLLAVVGAVVIAALSFLALSQFQEDAWTRFASESVRVGDPGHNLLVNAGGSRSLSDQASARE